MSEFTEQLDKIIVELDDLEIRTASQKRLYYSNDEQKVKENINHCLETIQRLAILFRIYLLMERK